MIEIGIFFMFNTVGCVVAWHTDIWIWMHDVCLLQTKYALIFLFAAFFGDFQVCIEQQCNQCEWNKSLNLQWTFFAVEKYKFYNIWYGIELNEDWRWYKTYGMDQHRFIANKHDERNINQTHHSKRVRKMISNLFIHHMRLLK